MNIEKILKTQNYSLAIKYVDILFDYLTSGISQEDFMESFSELTKFFVLEDGQQLPLDDRPELPFNFMRYKERWLEVLPVAFDIKSQQKQPLENDYRELANSCFNFLKEEKGYQPTENHVFVDSFYMNHEDLLLFFPEVEEKMLEQIKKNSNISNSPIVDLYKGLSELSKHLNEDLDNVQSLIDFYKVHKKELEEQYDIHYFLSQPSSILEEQTAKLYLNEIVLYKKEFASDLFLYFIRNPDLYNQLSEQGMPMFFEFFDWLQFGRFTLFTSYITNEHIERLTMHKNKDSFARYREAIFLSEHITNYNSYSFDEYDRDRIDLYNNSLRDGISTKLSFIKYLLDKHINWNLLFDDPKSNPIGRILESYTEFSKNHVMDNTLINYQLIAVKDVWQQQYLEYNLTAKEQIPYQKKTKV